MRGYRTSRHAGPYVVAGEPRKIKSVVQNVKVVGNIPVEPKQEAKAPQVSIAITPEKEDSVEIKNTDTVTPKEVVASPKKTSRKKKKTEEAIIQ